MNSQFLKYQQEADKLTQGPQTPQTRARLQFLLSAMSTMKRDFSEPSTDERRKVSTRFRDALLAETRTYAPMSTSLQPQIIEADFSSKMAQLMSSAGPLFFGSPVLTNIERPDLSPTKVPVCTDLAVGYDQTENATATEQELNFASVTMGKNTISSGIILISQDLLDDLQSWTAAETLIQRTASARLSRRQNQKFLPALVTALAANSSASVASAVANTLSHADLANLTSSVNAQYRHSETSGFLMSSATQKYIKVLSDAQARPLFEHVLDAEPTIFGYPVFVSDYADSVATANHPILFGDWSYLYSRHVPGFELVVMGERFAMDGYKGFILRQRGDIQFSVPSTSESPIKMLTIS